MSRTEHISRRLKLRHLNVLAAVIQKGSMAKAADHLAISQPVVSKSIADLENLLGVRLLDRTPQGVEATLYGRALLKRSMAIFDDLRTCVGEIEFLADATAGELRIGASESAGAGLLPTLVDGLVRRYPRLKFEVVQGDPNTLQERDLRERRVELAIMRPVTPTIAEDLEETILYKDHLRVVAGVNNPWAKRRKIELADLVDERWCLPPPDHPVGALVIDAFRRRNLKPPQNTVTVASAQWTSNLIMQGQFLGVHGSVFLHFNPVRDRLKVLPVDLQIPTSPVSVIALKNRTLSPLAQLFIDHAREITKPLARFA